MNRISMGRPYRSLSRTLLADIAIDADVNERAAVRVIDAYFRLRSLHWQRRCEAAGQAWGRPRRAVDPATCDRARTMLAAGESVRNVARQVGVPRSTLARVLARARVETV